MAIQDTKKNAPKFYSFSNPRESIKLPIGSKIVCKYGAKLDSKTNKVVVQVIEKYDITEQIQSYRRDTDIYYLINKFKNGDSSALTGGANRAFYANLVDMPSNLIDMTNILQQSEGMFNALDENFKKEHNLNNVKDWLDYLFSGKAIEDRQKAIEDKKVVKTDNVEVPTTKVETPTDNKEKK